MIKRRRKPWWPAAIHWIAKDVLPERAFRRWCVWRYRYEQRFTQVDAIVEAADAVGRGKEAREFFGLPQAPRRVPHPMDDPARREAAARRRAEDSDWDRKVAQWKDEALRRRGLVHVPIAHPPRQPVVALKVDEDGNVVDNEGQEMTPAEINDAVEAEAWHRTCPACAKFLSNGITTSQELRKHYSHDPCDGIPMGKL